MKEGGKDLARVFCSKKLNGSIFNVVIGSLSKKIWEWTWLRVNGYYYKKEKINTECLEKDVNLKATFTFVVVTKLLTCYAQVGCLRAPNMGDC